jgi:hypothetical protein
MLIGRSASGIFLFFLAIENRQSTFEISCGGIAQLVERQLCKLEVRGSNPLASSLRSRRRRERGLSRRSLGEGGRVFGLPNSSRELLLGKPPYDKILLRLHSAESDGTSAILCRVNQRFADAPQTSQLWPYSSHGQMEAVATQNLHCSWRS